MRRPLVSVFALVAALCPLSAGAANESNDSIDESWSTMLNTLVVTGTRSPKLLKDSPILTRVISSKDIRLSDATNITDLLQTELPGLEFTYSMNQQVSLNMQGFGGNSVLFLVDGERLAGETLNNVDYNRLDMSGVSRVEIVKGGASSLYGSSAVGGVVNIISNEESKPWRVNINGRYGAHNDQRYGLTAGFKQGIVGSTTTLRYHSIGSYDMKNDGDYNRFYGGYDWIVKERLVITPISDLKISLRGGYYMRQRDSQETLRDRYYDLSAGVKGEYKFKDNHNVELSYNFDQYDKGDFMVISDKYARKYRNLQHNVRALYTYTFLRDYTLTIGGDMMHDYLQSYQFADGGSNSQVTADGLAQIDMNFFDNHVNVVAGARYDYFSASSMSRLSPRVSLMYKVGNCNIRGSYSGGFRAPSLKEMYMDFDMAGIFMIYGNPDLKAESSHNLQLSTEYAQRYVNVTIGGFYNIVDNRITTAWNTALNGQMYTNIGKMNISGVEANASWRHTSGFGARVSFVYTHEHVAKNQPYVSSTRPHTATLRLDYGHDWNKFGFNVALNGRYLSSVNVDEYTSVSNYEETERVHYPGYMIWKLNLTLSYLKGVSLNVGIDNLFNYIPQYYYNNSPSTTGITISAGISVDLDKLFKS
ncbi:MAG: TonB-dependent receptor plug domain-containing protein [Lepagella sp.]